MAWVDSGGRVLIQWAAKNQDGTVSDWTEYFFTNMSDVRAVPKKPEPSDSPIIDDQPGWIAAVNIQGVVFMADHVGFNIDGQGRLVVGKWNDDPVDWPFLNGDGFGWVYTFDSLAPDSNLPVSAEYAAANPTQVGQNAFGQWCMLNTRQTATRYANTATLQAALALDPVEFQWTQSWLDDPNRLEWTDWPSGATAFKSNQTIHGVWLDEPTWQALQEARTVHGWREWGAQ
jgi:hypothetical protein